jgi:uncharacterized SAM-binding protein YcdF (DUF218 family)
MLEILAPLKPFFSALLMPPASPLLLLVIGWWLARWSRRTSRATMGLAIALLWLLSSESLTYTLSRWMLTSYAPPTMADVKSAQAIVVLGGGVEQLAPHVGQAELKPKAYARLRHGVHLSRQSGLPMAFAGGVGWRASGQLVSEAEVAQQTLQRDGLVDLRWLDTSSRDTQENARQMKRILSAQGIQRIVLVTHDWHMQRSLKHFEGVGFDVIPAPMGYLQPPDSWWLGWLPSSEGTETGYLVMHEWIGRLLARP